MNGRHRTVCRMSWFGLMLVTGFSTAWAHIDIEPKATIPNRWETFILNVPTETKSPTVEVNWRFQGALRWKPSDTGPTGIWHFDVTRAGWCARSSGPAGRFHRLPSMSSNSWPSWQSPVRMSGKPANAMPTIGEHLGAAHVQAEGSGLPTQKAEEALKTAQVAMTISFLGVGVATILIMVTLIAVWWGTHGKGRMDE